MKTLILIFSVTLSFAACGQLVTPLEGRWDLAIAKDGKEIPSWLEVRHSGRKTLIGRFVYAFGSARPISEVKLQNEKFSFSLPLQWEVGNRTMDFEGELKGDSLKGKMIFVDGKPYSFRGWRAPSLQREKHPEWAEPITLFNGKDLAGWHASGTNQWTAENGVLKSAKPGSNLLTDRTFTDFKLHIEFKYSKGGNSGVYLRGRYEVQVTDSKGLTPWDDQFSGIYGFVEPNQMVAKEAGEWQSFDITLIGRTVTVVANGVTVICNAIIPGITGGAINSFEHEPGPILLQGDHEPIEYRNIVITPAK
ncbi:MAG: DUF1080 domain-containing protein [Bacteroidetes bacterium]|nr:DUF1080 domain-containing protein [Bacteroidota bacterium]MBS1540307.1 DUF1080 domain-containing protein [Bacteroidota bacterium]